MVLNTHFSSFWIHSPGRDYMSEYVEYTLKDMVSSVQQDGDGK